MSRESIIERQRDRERRRTYESWFKSLSTIEQGAIWYPIAVLRAHRLSMGILAADAADRASA